MNIVGIYNLLLSLITEIVFKNCIMYTKCQRKIILKFINNNEGDLFIDEKVLDDHLDSHIQIEIDYAGINRADILQRKGHYPPPNGESDITGLECSGKVSKLGKLVKKFSLGDQVCAILAGGGYAEFVNVDEKQVMPLPSNLNSLEAGGLPETTLTVYENISSPLKITGMKSDEIKKRVWKVAELLKLSAMLDKKPDELSGGQQKRTALARALVKDSDLILLEEPLANLDFKLREELREELPKLFEDRDCIVVYATTEPLDALMIGGNTATLLEGNVIQYGKTLDVYSKPENLTSAKVFSDPPMNIVEIVKTGDTFKLADNNVQWKSNLQIKDGKYKIGIRPHNITTYKEGNNSVEINGKVLISELSGSESLIHFTNGNLNWVSLSNGIQQKNIGEDTKLHMNVNEFLYFDQNNRLVNHG